MIKLEEYEEICPRCNGRCKVIVGATCATGYHQEIFDNCPTCGGEGIIDWVDMIMRGIDVTNKKQKKSIING